MAPESLSWFIKVMFDSINILPAPSRKSHVITEIFKAWKENITALIEEVEDPIDDDHGSRARATYLIYTLIDSFVYCEPDDFPYYFPVHDFNF